MCQSQDCWLHSFIMLYGEQTTVKTILIINPQSSSGIDIFLVLRRCTIQSTSSIACFYCCLTRCHALRLFREIRHSGQFIHHVQVYLIHTNHYNNAPMRPISYSSCSLFIYSCSFCRWMDNGIGTCENCTWFALLSTQSKPKSITSPSPVHHQARSDHGWIRVCKF